MSGMQLWHFVVSYLQCLCVPSQWSVKTFFFHTIFFCFFTHGVLTGVKFRVIVIWPINYWDKVGDKAGNFTLHNCRVPLYDVKIIHSCSIILWYHCKKWNPIMQIINTWHIWDVFLKYVHCTLDVHTRAQNVYLDWPAYKVKWPCSREQEWKWKGCHSHQLFSIWFLWYEELMI